jgi:hypothetical protein
MCLYRPKNFVGVPEPVATGVLLSIEEHLFLLTAAHAIEQFGHYPPLIPLAGRIIGIVGESYRTGLPKSGSHNDDPLDAAVFRIDNAEREAIRSIALGLKDLEPEDEAHESKHLLIGHAIRRFRRVKRELISDPLVLLVDGVPDLDYQKAGINPATHLLMKWDKRTASIDGIEQAPSLRGVSGGAVWRLPGKNESKASVGLAGIFIERKQQPLALVATSVLLHLQLIAKFHPELIGTINKRIDALNKRRA